MNEYNAIPTIISTIPEIRLYPAWVPVEVRFVNGEKVCRPVDIRNGKTASASNSDSWTTYPRAIDYMDNNHDIEYLGFALTKEANIFCLNFSQRPGLYEFTAGAARRIVERLNTYMEKAPTGRGVQVIGIGSLAHHTMKNRLCYLKAMSWNHFVTFTGNALNGCTVRNCQRELADLQKRGVLRFSYERLLKMRAIRPIRETPKGSGLTYGQTGS